MFKELRRKNNSMPEDETLELLINGEYGILATSNKDNQPYAQPISYVVIGNYIYCHCALKGAKVDNLKENDKVSFSVVGKTKPIFEDNDFTSLYESVIVFGKATFVENKEEKIDSLTKLSLKYFPDKEDKIEGILDAMLDHTGVFKISIDHICGKARR